MFVTRYPGNSYREFLAAFHSSLWSFYSRRKKKRNYDRQDKKIWHCNGTSVTTLNKLMHIRKCCNLSFAQLHKGMTFSIHETLTYISSWSRVVYLIRTANQRTSLLNSCTPYRRNQYHFYSKGFILRLLIRTEDVISL